MIELLILSCSKALVKAKLVLLWIRNQSFYNTVFSQHDINVPISSDTKVRRRFESLNTKVRSFENNFHYITIH